MDNKAIESQQYDILDITKLILSFFVVAIHAELLPNVLYPWLRIAVPMFFIISSFLFFSKIKTKTDSDKKNALVIYIKRNLVLYITWFVILLPFTIVVRKSWFDAGFVHGLLCCLRALLFGSTFRASWYITACITSVPLVLLISKKWGNKRLFLLSFALYVICCLVSSYQLLIEGTNSEWLIRLSKTVFGGMESSFIFAMFWVSLGKYFAEKETAATRANLLLKCGISGGLLLVEYHVVVNMLEGSRFSSCYILLVPFCFFLFDYLHSFQDLHIRHAKEVRKCATFLYLTHCSALTCISFVARHVFQYDNKLIIYFITCASMLLVAIAFIALSKKAAWRFLNLLW